MKQYFIGFLLFSTFSLNAQNKNLDSLFQTLNNNKNDTTKINVLIKITEYYVITSNLDSAMKYALHAEQNAKKVNYKRGQAQSYHYIGVINDMMGNYEKALNY